MELENFKALVQRLEAELDALKLALKDQVDTNERLAEDLRLKIEECRPHSKEIEDLKALNRGLESDLYAINKAFIDQE